jgi:hypothetical protein
MRIGLSAVKNGKMSSGTVRVLIISIVVSVGLFFLCENRNRPIGGYARPRPTAVQHRERTPGPGEVPITILDPAQAAASGSSSRNPETLRQAIADRQPHDLALLEAAERSGEAGAREAAEALLQLRDARATPAALEAFVARDLARPPTVLAAARRWLDAELGPADAGAGPPPGRGPAVKRFTSADAGMHVSD